MARPKATVEKALRITIKPKSRLLIAVSGGLDSMALLHGCLALSQKLKLTIEVAHVDHGLRESSKRDAEFVETAARKAGIEYHLFRPSEGPGDENVEAWGRRVRYSFFRRVLEERRLEMVLTAHTANDAAETLLMRLVSNKEPVGIERWDPQRRCLRPLISVPRKVLSEYVKEHNISFVEDETNQDLGFLRNRVRHVLLPLLRSEFDPRIEETLALRAIGLHEDMRFLSSLVSEAVSRADAYPRYGREWLRSVREELSGMPKPLRWRFAEQLFKRGLGYNLGRLRSEKLVEFLLGRRLAFELPGGVTLRAKNGGLAEVTRER